MNIDRLTVLLFFVIMAELAILCFCIGWAFRGEVWGEWTTFGFMGIIGCVFAILAVIGAMNYIGALPLEER